MEKNVPVGESQSFCRTTCHTSTTNRSDARYAALVPPFCDGNTTTDDRLDGGAAPDLRSMVRRTDGTDYGLFGGGEEGPAEGLPAPIRIAVPVGSCLIVRPSLIHRGTENPHGHRQLRCLHSFLARHVDCRDHPAFAEYTALLQPFAQKSRTPTVAKLFQIGLCGVVEADLALCCNYWSAGLLGERLYECIFVYSRPLSRT